MIGNFFTFIFTDLISLELYDDTDFLKSWLPDLARTSDFLR